MGARMTALVAVVRAHARGHYDEGGWDYVVEGCYEDEDLARLIGGARSPSGAVRRVGEVLAVRADRRDDVEKEVF